MRWRSLAFEPRRHLAKFLGQGVHLVEVGDAVVVDEALDLFEACRRQGFERSPSDSSLKLRAVPRLWDGRLQVRISLRSRKLG